jgi:hypothetical protein
MKYKVVITREIGGYDISVFDQNGKVIKSNWKHNYSNANQAAGIFADFYRDDEGEIAEIINEF